MGEHIAAAAGRGGDLPFYGAEFSGTGSPGTNARAPQWRDRLLGRRGHALSVAALLVVTVLFTVPVWGEIRVRIVERMPDAESGAVGIGTAIGWSTAALANMATVGVLGVVFGVVGAVAMRWARPAAAPAAPASPAAFVRARRAFTVGWALFVAGKFTGWSLVCVLTGGRLADAAASLTRPDPWLVLLFGALLWSGRSALGAAWPRACAVAAAMTAVFGVTSLLLLT
ncbi:hypothetical protein ACIBKX_22890 [Streptomyces sp. NPDC050658]|uniref:hypothetical protein n=1 Tax=unclassified Streptomyces TaxID=2593676 RepID=UPI00342AD3E0